MPGQPQFCVRVLSTRHAGYGQVRHWLVVAMTVGHPVGAEVSVVVWWSPVAATLCETGQQQVGRTEAAGVGGAHLHGSPDGEEDGKRVHVGWLQTSVRLSKAALAVRFQLEDRLRESPSRCRRGASYPIRHKGLPTHSCLLMGFSSLAACNIRHAAAVLLGLGVPSQSPGIGRQRGRGVSAPLIGRTAPKWQDGPRIDERHPSLIRQHCSRPLALAFCMQRSGGRRRSLGLGQTAWHASALSGSKPGSSVLPTLVDPDRVW